MSQPLPPISLAPPQYQQTEIHTSMATDEAAAVAAAAQPIIARASQPLAPAIGVPAQVKTIQLVIIPLERWEIVEKQQNFLIFSVPEYRGMFSIDMRNTIAAQWLPFAYRRRVYAPNPYRNNEFCLGEMVTPNRNVNFEPEEAPDETIPHMIVDFSISTFLYTGTPVPSIDRRQIWPA